MPELASGLPPWNELEGSEGGPWLVSPCAQQLLAPATRVTLGAIEQALDESALADGQEHLQRLVAELAQEAIQDLQTHAIPGLSVVAIARGIFLGGMALLSSLPLDLDRRLQRARERAVLFVLTSDAHQTDELDRVEYAAMNAHRAWIPPERIVNAWAPKELLKFLEAKRPHAAARGAR